MAAFRSARGTLLPISMTPSPTGRVLSKALALVKLRMAKLSSHLSGQGTRFPWSSYSTRILRANIPLDLNTDREGRLDSRSLWSILCPGAYVSSGGSHDLVDLCDYRGPHRG